MPDGVGYDYQPRGTMRADQSGQTGRLTPQEAIRILSFRVPKRAPQAFTPLVPQGSGQVQAGGSALNTILRALMTSMDPQGGMDGPAESVVQQREMQPAASRLTFTPTGGAGSVVAPPTPSTYRAPTITPGDDGTGRGVRNLFGDLVTDDPTEGTKTTADDTQSLGSFAGWLSRERDMNGRGAEPLIGPGSNPDDGFGGRSRY